MSHLWLTSQWRGTLVLLDIVTADISREHTVRMSMGRLEQATSRYKLSALTNQLKVSNGKELSLSKWCIKVKFMN